MFFSRSQPQWLIVGLGNPGPRFAGTRHNAGFLVLDRLASQLGVKIDRARFSGYTARAQLAGQPVLLLKPTTMMNLSGQSVRQAARYYGIAPEHIVVVFDDISLAPGRLRVRAAGSAGGHNGIKSIIAELGSQDFPRVKLGVGDRPRPDYDLADWVLGRFTDSERKLVSDAADRAAGAGEEILAHGPAAAANRYNGT